MSAPPEAAVWMYESGLSCKDVAPMFGVSETTVKRWMRKAGVIRSDASKRGRPLQDECKAGHDLSEWRRRDPSGNPYCLLCNRERGKRNYQKRKSMAKKTTPPKQDPGKTSGSFGKPHPIRPGACPTCGALPACVPPKHGGKK